MTREEYEAELKRIDDEYDVASSAILAEYRVEFIELDEFARKEEEPWWKIYGAGSMSGRDLPFEQLRTEHKRRREALQARYAPRYLEIDRNYQEQRRRLCRAVEG